MKKIINIVLVSLGLSISSNTWADADSQSAAEVNLKLTELLADQELAGIVWSSVSENQTLVSAAGLNNVSNHIPMTKLNAVHVGSVTKTLLGIGVLRLIASTGLSLDTEVARLLPSLSITNRWQTEAPIRVRHLLEHTAGLDNLRMWQFLNTQATADTLLEEAFPITNGSLLSVRSKPGSQYSYSNIGYVLLAIVIEKVADERYEDYLDRELLAPLGMHQSTFHFTHQNQNSQLAMGYLDNLQSLTAQPSYLRPAGQFTTTANDMAIFLTFLLDGGSLNGEQFISPEMMSQLAIPSTTVASKAGLSIGHGLALAGRDRHGVIGHCHPGTTFGFRANLCVFPEQGKAFFYAVNTDNETADYEQLTKLFMNTLNLHEIDTSTHSQQWTNEKRTLVEGFYLPSPNNMAEFEWLDRVFNFLKLEWQDKHLIITALQGSEKKLIPISENLLRAADRKAASHVIIESDQGLFISDGLHTYKRVPIWQMLLYWLSPILGFFGLAYILLVSAWRLLSRKPSLNKQLRLPFANLLLFVLPILAFRHQSFMQFGELTLASGLLFMVSAALPISLLISIFNNVWFRPQSPALVYDSLAMASLLQLCMVLVYWRLLPIMFWGPS